MTGLQLRGPPDTGPNRQQGLPATRDQRGDPHDVPDTDTGLNGNQAAPGRPQSGGVLKVVPEVGGSVTKYQAGWPGQRHNSSRNSSVTGHH